MHKRKKQLVLQTVPQFITHAGDEKKTKQMIKPKQCEDYCSFFFYPYSHLCLSCLVFTCKSLVRQQETDVCSAEFTARGAGVMHWAHPKLSRPTNGASPRRRARRYCYGCHRKWTTSSVCVCVCDKAAHLHVTRALLASSPLSLPHPTCPLFRHVDSARPPSRCRSCRARTHANVETEENLPDKTPCANHPSPLLLTVTTFCPSAATAVALPSPYFWWRSVSHTSFSLSRSICQSACHSSVAPLSIRPVSQLVPEPSFGLPCLSNANLICSSVPESFSRFPLCTMGPTWNNYWLT